MTSEYVPLAMVVAVAAPPSSARTTPATGWFDSESTIVPVMVTAAGAADAFDVVATVCTPATRRKDSTAAKIRTDALDEPVTRCPFEH
jgi:hypothetical protein